MRHLSLELDDTTLRSLADLADIKAESISELIKQAINDYLDREREEAEDEARYLDCLENGGIDNYTVIAWLEGLGRGENKPCPR